MNNRWLWLTIAAVAVAGLAGGWLMAQQGRLYAHPPQVKYSYLPEEYSEPYIPTRAESKALEATVYSPVRYALTDRLMMANFGVRALPSSLRIVAETDTQPRWNTYLGNGRFNCSDRELRAAYEEAADAIIRDTVRLFFPEISTNDVQITFFIRDAAVGTWQGGQMTLEGEE